MSWFPIRKEDYNRERPKEASKRLGLKRLKLPTHLKTKRKKCSLCKNLAVKVLTVKSESKRFCLAHLEQYERKDLRYQAKFQKANEL